MKISRSQIDQVLQALAPRSDGVGDNRPALRAVGKGQDEVALSQATARIRSLCQMIEDMPDIRHDRLAEVMEALDRQDYNPSAVEVAEKMLGRLVADQLK